MSAQFDPNANKLFLKVLQKAYASTEGAEAQSKYSRWFDLEGPSAPPQNQTEHTMQQRIVEFMKAELTKTGEESYAMFAEKMAKFSHEMQRSVGAGMINLQHGAARFGQIVEKHANRYETIRFFTTESDVNIDGNRGDRWLGVGDPNRFQKKFFAVAQTMDRNANLIGINQDRGDKGVMFVTANPMEALCQISALSTGKSVDFFRSKLPGNAPQQQATPQQLVQSASAAMRPR